MLDSLPASVMKAVKGEYGIPIQGLWKATWRPLIQMPKIFWQAFGLGFLILFSSVALLGIVSRLGGLTLAHYMFFPLV